MWGAGLMRYRTLGWLCGVTLLLVMGGVDSGVQAQGAKGDVNGDGVVDIKDAVLLVQHLKNPSGKPLSDAQKDAADIFPLPGVGGRSVGDGQLTQEDARQLLRFVVGLLGANALRGQITPLITRLNPSNGPVGTRVEIEGQFFAAGKPKENVVTFGGVEATVSEATETRIVVNVPGGASTGPVLVTTPLGTTPNNEVFTVTGQPQGRFEPPAGMNAADFDILNALGNATRQGADFTIPVRDEMPLVTVATPKNPDQQTFFYAVTLSANQPFIINAASTAEALVFMNPFLMTLDPLLAEHILNIIRQDAKVQVFAQVITQIYPQGGDPFSNPTFLQAYEEAVISVGNSAAIQSLAQGRRQVVDSQLAGAKRQGTLERNALSHPLDLDFLELTGSGRQMKVKGIPFNPVDWLVTFREVDVERAFPNGRRDYNRVLLERQTLTTFPLTGRFEEQRAVSADLLASRLNLVSFLFKELAKVVNNALVDETVEFSGDHDALYLMRGVGPAFTPLDEFSFVTGNMLETYTRVVAINLMTGAMDLISLLVDLKVLNLPKPKLEEIFGKLVIEVNKLIPTIQSDADFLKAVVKIAGFLVKELANLGLKALEKSTIAWLQAVAETFNAVTKPLKIAAGIGAVVERASGLVRTSTLESAFIMVGNPFGFEIVSVTPPGGSPGDEIRIVIRKARFDAASQFDHVTFGEALGERAFEGQVINVAPPVGDTQELTVRMPDELRNLADGEHDLTVLAQGKRGEGKFQLVNRPTVTSMTPMEGFAAVDNFDGQPFGGSTVRLMGFGFSPSDTFLFGGGIEATTKSGSSGNVLLDVPKNAQSGPITIRRQVSATDIREGQSPPFTVAGAPVIDNVNPTRGPAGTTVIFTVSNLGSDADPARVRFDGEEPGVIRRGNQLHVVVPVAVAPQPGDPPRVVTVTILTPAGQAQTNFTVEPGRAAGGGIIVGDLATLPGVSPISLSRALDLAAGVGQPVQDDGDGNDDPPFEEGDFVTDNGTMATPRFPVGAEFADAISIHNDRGNFNEAVGNFTLASDFDSLTMFPNVVIRGTLTITGSNNTVNVTVRGSSGHGIVIRGNNNTVTAICDGNAGDGVRIEGGKFNKVNVQASGNGGNGVTLTGGAVGNRLGISTGAANRFDGNPNPTPGNAGHGVLFMGDASSNTIDDFGGASDISRNQGDGVRLEGAGVKNNQLIGIDCNANGGNGVTVTNGASDNSLEVRAADNTKSGIALIASNPPQRTTVIGDCQRNGDYGVLVSGIADEMTSVFAVTVGNQKAGLRVEKGTSGVRFDLTSNGDAAGLEMDGADVVNNSVIGGVGGSVGNGVVLTNAQRNRLNLSQVGGCGGSGVVISGGKENQLVSRVTNNQGDGVHLTNGAEKNRVQNDKDLTGLIRAPVTGNRNGIVLDGGAKNNLIQDADVNANREHGVVMQGAGTTGNRLINSQTVGNAMDGIRIQNGASNNNIGTDAGGGLVIRDNAQAGIRITGAGTKENVVLGCMITRGNRQQQAGIIIEDQAESNVIGGLTDKERNTVSFEQNGIIVRNGAKKTVIQNNDINSNTGIGILLDNVSDALIGGNDPRSRNEVGFNTAVGIQLQGANTTNNRILNNNVVRSQDGFLIRDGATNNLLEKNVSQFNFQTGMKVMGASQNRLLQNVIFFNTGEGVLFTDGATDNLMRGNQIFNNGVGVGVNRATTLRNTIRNNGITANTGEGISLTNGGNTEIPPPVLTGVSSNAIIGTATAPDGSTVEIFKDPADEGEESIATATVVSGRFRVPIDLKPTDVGVLFQLNATVTDPDGNTSEFGGLTQQTPAAVSQFVFTSTRDGNPEIYVQDGFRPFPTRLTNNPADDHSPALFSNTLTVAFVSTRDGNPEIYTMPFSGVTTRLTNNPAPDYDPMWSPDGSKIAFVSERDGNPEIYVMNANGANVTRLTNDAGVDRSPVFSPDGTKIAFASNRTGNFEIFVMNADGSNPQAITQNPAADMQPTWSPDGTQISFVSDRDGNPEVYAMMTDGTNVARLTNNPATDVNPSWLSGGQGLAFASNRDEGFELYLMGRSGGGVTRFTVSNGDNTQPSAGRR